MPRPVKCRKVCHFPNVLEFLPADDTEKKMPIVLTVDEYETEKRLIVFRYFQDMTQTEVAKKMGMSQVQISRMEKRILKKLREISHKL